MSRGFWVVLGALIGLFAGAWVGVAVAHLLFDCCYGETELPAFGSVIGLGVGLVLAWYVPRAWRRH